MTVSLVRVESEWHVFTDSRAAWSFYVEWRDYRDCECLLECPVDASLEGYSMTHSYYAKDGRVYVRETGKDDREAGTAITANGRDLERHDIALQAARRQREQTR